MCDNQCGGNKGSGGSGGGPPENVPAWLKCPPSLKERSYPVPQGVDILPISVGGRNGSSKKKFKCGQCGQDKPPANAKPKASADCPMMKGRCETMDDSSKSGGLIDKIKAFFGIGKDPRFEALVSKLDEDQFRQHRDLFNTPLLVRKDGYMTPFLKVDCQAAAACTVPDQQQQDDCDYECECECEDDDEYDEEDCEDDEDDEECIEDEEGECVLEETAECLDEDCELSFDKDNNLEEEDEDGCAEAMNSFIVRVQAPFSSTNDTCEQIISRLTNSKQYPEPGPKPERKKKEVELVVKQISVENPQPKKKCNKKPCKTKDQKAPPAPILAPVDPCAPPPPTATTATETTPPAQDPACECDCPEDCECLPFPEGEGPTTEPEIPEVPPQNDCETLSELELLAKKLKDIRCGCPKKPCPKNPCDAFPGLTCYGNDGTSVWTPPPPPPCPRCGAGTRGDTDGCYLCHITRRMRSGIPEIRGEIPADFADSSKKDNGDTSDLCTPEYLPDGSLKYQGGACLNLMEKFLWGMEKRTPPGGFYDRYKGKSGELPPEPKKDRCQEIEERPRYKGGMTISQCCDYLWGRVTEEPQPEPKRKCKGPEPPKSGDKCPPPPK